MRKILFVVISLSLLLSGCVSDDITDLRIYVKKTKASAKGKVKAIPEFKQSEPYAYTGEEVRDPFKPVVDVEVASGAYNGPRPDDNRLKEPLEDFSLDSLKMVGTLKQKEDDWILIKDPDGLLHRVAIGQYMGKNYGKVTNISEEEVTLLELVPDRRDGWVERDASIALSE